MLMDKKDRTIKDLKERNDKLVNEYRCSESRFFSSQYKAEKLEQENRKLKEKIEYLKNQKENKDNWFQLIADIGFDYDGYNDVENLKHLIDELVKFALNGRDNYKYEDIFEEIEKGDSNE